jgi:TRAP-type mannitol/chloroaromatic compound transport system substrate-binding protein
MPPEAGGWYSREVRSIKDFDGLKMRTFGLGAQVLELLGVEPQLIAPSKLIDALQRQTLDAAEFSIPAIDVSVGFERAGPLDYYFPGWHQQTMLFELLIGRSTWLKVSKTQRRQIHTACGHSLAESIAEGEALQARAIHDLRRCGVELRRFRAPVLNKLAKALREVAALLSTKSKNFEHNWTSMTRFREEYKLWRDPGYIR